jgi:hypothetical protein
MYSLANADTELTSTTTIPKYVLTMPGLLRLATETPLQIFEILVSEEILHKRSENDVASLELQYSTGTKSFRAPAITRVCRRLRFEAIPIFYTNYRWTVDLLIPLGHHHSWM